MFLATTKSISYTVYSCKFIALHGRLSHERAARKKEQEYLSGMLIVDPPSHLLIGPNVQSANEKFLENSLLAINNGRACRMKWSVSLELTGVLLGINR